MHMQEAGYGSIINMSSMSSLSKSPAISAYAASKAAINHMTANLAHDYGPIVRINAVGLGAVKTGALALCSHLKLNSACLHIHPLNV